MSSHPLTSGLRAVAQLGVFQISQVPLIVPGVWRPYLSAMVPDLWLNEGGQSPTGRLVISALRRLGPARSGLFNYRPLALQSCCFAGVFSSPYLIDHVVKGHAAYPKLQKQAVKRSAYLQQNHIHQNNNIPFTWNRPPLTLTGL
ncbi:FGGY carbohydrate kinase domain-containing protein-like isoform X1 [Oncorhynchus kisutch]|uniref:FGGY carbohydrate kinase domain-containing protein-like isoform X1 n=1 Tax=Oncorhynchus kisutch TaxID=8019 RepID=UPI0012DE7AA9|nr:FGGY carbohydrate kinase domain-containing protein-like isoform X1 [Oncorhynchus kisutch]